jgi:predicted transcriptional regulator YdeE
MLHTCARPGLPCQAIAGKTFGGDPTIPAYVAFPLALALTADCGDWIVAPEAYMDVRIEARGKMLLVGMCFFGNPFSRASAWEEENEIGFLWKRFYTFLGSSPGAILSRADNGMVGYELHIAGPESEKTGCYEVFVGLEVLGLDSMPVVCTAKILPPADYAVVTVRGEEIRGDWMGRLYSEIVPGLGRRANETFSFERYDARFKGMDRLDESELEYHIPLVKLAGA